MTKTVTCSNCTENCDSWNSALPCGYLRCTLDTHRERGFSDNDLYRLFAVEAQGIDCGSSLSLDEQIDAIDFDSINFELDNDF